jgi:hypothetical protein
VRGTIAGSAETPEPIARQFVIVCLFLILSMASFGQSNATDGRSRIHP